MEESYIGKNQRKMRWGYTTGACAAAASMAAAALLLGGGPVEQVRLETPGGKELEINIENMTAEGSWASCAVRKDAGDDPDVTDGFLVYSRIWRENPFEGRWEYMKSGCYDCEIGEIHLFLTGGVGVGRVTKRGLSCQVGKAAINPVPRQMIFTQVEKICRRQNFCGSLWIEISVPEGVEAAAHTFNGRLGIEGGISILGTSGLVEPMSEKALLETIRLELRQKWLEGRRQVILTPGNYGQQFLTRVMGLNLDQAVKCSNFIGNAIDMAAEEGVERLLLVGHGGKLIKVAAGIMNTHSSMADGRMEILTAYAATCVESREMAGAILSSTTVDEAMRLLETAEGLREAVMGKVMAAVERHLRNRAAGRLSIEAVIFTNERGILGMTSGAREALERLSTDTAVF